MAKGDILNFQRSKLGAFGRSQLGARKRTHKSPLYVGGQFFQAGGIDAWRIASWDGQWHNLSVASDPVLYPGLGQPYDDDTLTDIMSLTIDRAEGLRDLETQESLQLQHFLYVAGGGHVDQGGNLLAGDPLDAEATLFQPIWVNDWFDAAPEYSELDGETRDCIAWSSGVVVLSITGKVHFFNRHVWEWSQLGGDIPHVDQMYTMKTGVLMGLSSWPFPLQTYSSDTDNWTSWPDVFSLGESINGFDSIVERVVEVPRECVDSVSHGTSETVLLVMGRIYRNTGDGRSWVGIARWNPDDELFNGLNLTEWELGSLGDADSFTSSHVFDVAIVLDKVTDPENPRYVLFAGGAFASRPDVGAPVFDNLAQFNVFTKTWEAVPQGGFPPGGGENLIRAMTTWGGKLVVAGHFGPSIADPTSQLLNGIARLGIGEAWEDMQGGLSAPQGVISSVAHHGECLYSREDFIHHN